MEHQLVIHDFFQLVLTEEIIQNHSEIIRRISVVISGAQKLRRHLIIFHNGRFSILQAHRADLLIRSSLPYNLGAAYTILCDGCTDKGRICNSLQNIVYREAVQPLYTELMQFIQETCFVHRTEPAAVSVRRGRHTEPVFHIDLSLIIGSRCHVLTEEKYHLRIVSEIRMFLHEGNRCVMVFIACHNEKREKSSCLMDNIHHVLNKSLHDINRMRKTDVIHAFRIVRSQSCSHSAGKQNRSHLSCTNLLQSDGVIFLFSLLYLRNFQCL